MRKSILAAALFAASTFAVTAHAYSLSDDLQTNQQRIAAGQAEYSWEGYSFLPPSMTSFRVHGLALGSALPARCAVQPTTSPCSIPVGKDTPDLFVVTGLKAEPVYGSYATSALVVTSSTGSIVGVDQPLSPQDQDVHAIAVGLRNIFGAPESADSSTAVFDQGAVALSMNRDPQGTAASVWLVDRSALVVNAPFVAGTAPVANFKRWSVEAVAVK